MKSIYCNGLSRTGWCLALLSLCLAGAEGQSRSSRSNWIDRAATNPPLLEQKPIDASLEKFWNLPEKQSGEIRQVERRNPSAPVNGARYEPRGVSMNQKRKTRGRRGYFGINLFNLIPVIDIVHGEVVEDSVDHVEGRK